MGRPTDHRWAMYRNLVTDLLDHEKIQTTEVRAKVAEELAEKKSAPEVPLELAVAAFIESTPADLRQRLKHTLSYRGLDPDDYEAAFSA